jgi:hypothetical protein
MGLLGNGGQFDPDKEKCTLDQENQKFQCKFADKDGDEVRNGAIEVKVDENGEIVGSSHELEGFTQQEKERLKQITGSQLQQEIESGPLSGYEDKASL